MATSISLLPTETLQEISEYLTVADLPMLIHVCTGLRDRLSQRYVQRACLHILSGGLSVQVFNTGFQALSIWRRSSWFVCPEFLRATFSANAAQSEREVSQICTFLDSLEPTSRLHTVRLYFAMGNYHQLYQLIKCIGRFTTVTLRFRVPPNNPLPPAPILLPAHSLLTTFVLKVPLPFTNSLGQWLRSTLSTSPIIDLTLYLDGLVYIAWDVLLHDLKIPRLCKLQLAGRLSVTGVVNFLQEHPNIEVLKFGKSCAAWPPPFNNPSSLALPNLCELSGPLSQVAHLLNILSPSPSLTHVLISSQNIIIHNTRGILLLFILLSNLGKFTVETLITTIGDERHLLDYAEAIRFAPGNALESITEVEVRHSALSDAGMMHLSAFATALPNVEKLAVFMVDSTSPHRRLLDVWEAAPHLNVISFFTESYGLITMSHST